MNSDDLRQPDDRPNPPTWTTGGITIDSNKWVRELAERLASQVRAEALEAAARLVDDQYSDVDHPFAGDAIRALADKTEK